MHEEEKKVVSSIVTQLPHMVLLMLTVVVFLIAMDRKEANDDARKATNNIVQELRIKHCHEVQTRGIETIKQNDQLLREYSIINEKLIYSINELIDTIEQRLPPVTN